MVPWASFNWNVPFERIDELPARGLRGHVLRAHGVIGRVELILRVLTSGHSTFTRYSKA